MASSNIDPTLKSTLTDPPKPVSKSELKNALQSAKNEIEALQAGTSFDAGAVDTATLKDGAVSTVKISDNGVTDEKLSDMDANTVKANPTGASADPQNLSVPSSRILARLASGGLKAATPSEIRTLLNVEDGATASSDFESGTTMLFRQSTAPTNWTKTTTGIDDHSLRVTTGNISSGGSSGFSSVFASGRSVSVQNAGSHNHGGTNNTTLSTSQIPSHGHDSKSTSDSGSDPDNHRQGTGNADASSATHIDNTGGGGSHSHGISNDGSHSHTATIGMDVKFIDVIEATKD